VQTLSQAGQNAVSDLSYRYNLSPAAVEHMLIAVNNGAGTMAQFNCPELGGSGQWMRGGMTMVGDMFNYGLKSTVDNLCNELSNLLATTQVFPVAPAGTPGSNQWWPANLGSPFSSGGQNNTRYAVFAGRLAVEVNGQVTVYDTLDHQIGGVSQQQGGDSSLTFSSQYGTISVNSLPVVSGVAQAPPPNNNFAAPAPQPQNEPAAVESTSFALTPAPVPGQSNNNASGSFADNNVQVSNGDSSQLLTLIEKLAQLHGAGVLSDDEFNAKKQDLLSRL